MPFPGREGQDLIRFCNQKPVDQLVPFTNFQESHLLKPIQNAHSFISKRNPEKLIAFKHHVHKRKEAQHKFYL